MLLQLVVAVDCFELLQLFEAHHRVCCDFVVDRDDCGFAAGCELDLAVHGSAG